MTPERILELAKTMGLMLHGHSPEVQSAVLAELLSLWLAGHRPDVRGEARAMHDKLVDELIVVNAKKLWGSVMAERHIGVTIVHILLEDVAKDPSRLARAMEIAERDLTPLFAPERGSALKYLADAIRKFNRKEN